MSRLDSLTMQLESAITDSARVYILVDLSNEYSKVDLQLSLKYSDEAMELSKEAENPMLQDYALFNSASVYYYQGLFEEAAKQFSTYLQNVKEQGNKKDIARALVNLGAIWLNLSNFENARNYFEQALKTFDQLVESNEMSGTSYEIITVYNNLGIVCQNSGNPEGAIENYIQGISLARSANDEHNLSMLLNNVGSVYMEQGKLAEALTNMTEALNIRIKNNDITGQAQSYRTMASLFTDQKDDQKKIDYLYKGLSLAREVGNQMVLLNLTEMLFQFYNERHNPDSALKYHILFTEIIEKLNQEETLKELTRAEITSQFREKEKLQELEQKRRELIYLLIGLSLVLSIAIVGLLYFLARNRLRRIRLLKENIELESKNLELLKDNLESELEIKNKELATNVMYTIQKNENIHTIIKKLVSVSQNMRNEDQSALFNVIRDLEKTKETSVWSEFEVRFNQVHTSFYEKLNAINPGLSPNERRLCAFLRLNMSTKEIAAITGQATRSIDVARTRMRKKLNLTNSETGLIEFLSSI